jgi:hypothetical protein
MADDDTDPSDRTEESAAGRAVSARIKSGARAPVSTEGRIHQTDEETDPSDRSEESS